MNCKKLASKSLQMQEPANSAEDGTFKELSSLLEIYGIQYAAYYMLINYSSFSPDTYISVQKTFVRTFGFFTGLRLEKY